MILCELPHTKKYGLIIKLCIRNYLKKTLRQNKKKKKELKKKSSKIGMLELVDRFRLGRNGFITVQVQILLPIRGRNNMI